MTCDADEMKLNGGCLAELEGKGGGEWGVAGGQKECVVGCGFELLCGCVVCLRLGALEPNLAKSL